jgi:hypothetical protein
VQSGVTVELDDLVQALLGVAVLAEVHGHAL